MKILVEVSHTAQHDVRTGIQAVVRGLLSGLAQAGAGFQTVRWSRWRNTFVPLDRSQKQRLGIDRLSEDHQWPDRTDRVWLLFPEVIYGRKLSRMIAHAREQRMRIAAIFHDAIPVTHPELVRREARKFHSAYMTALCNADLIIAVSESAAEEFRVFSQKRRAHCPAIFVCYSAGELAGEERAAAKPPAAAEAVNILCVSTLEPRKNHKTLLEAFELACSAVPQPKLYLHLVGDRYKDAGHVVELVKAATRCNPNILWHGKITDHQLAKLYHESDFTIYPSFLEGFGLAISQSLWNRRPCICANYGAMAEIAKEGGCLTVDVRDAAKLSDAMVTLATRLNLRQELFREIDDRPPRTWQVYATEICQLLENVDRSEVLQKM
jgi:glycosyltransferase involved in cell wall biosynthesis